MSRVESALPTAQRMRATATAVMMQRVRAGKYKYGRDGNGTVRERETM